MSGKSMRRTTGLTRGHGRLARSAILIAPALAVLAGLVAGVPAASAVTGHVSAAKASTGCLHATGPFRVDGTEVIGAGNRVFVPYGTTVPGLANVITKRNEQGKPANGWPVTEPADLRKINATASSWCGNTVRLQISQDNLLGDLGKSFSTAYMNAIKKEVALAEHDHLVVVINDQTETSNLSFQLAPTPGTETFWKDIIKVYGSDKQVIFDLFNEPRLTGLSGSAMWRTWNAGGSYLGRNYVGMAKLARDLRAVDKRNLFWVEGPDYADTFAGMERDHALLSTSGVIYAIHHPAGDHDTAAWYDDFGYLVNTHVAPVVIGEWTNYRPIKNANSECWGNAPTKVPVFLRYLAGHGIGMTAYQLANGLLTTSDQDLATTTSFQHGWTCQVSPKPTNEGAGQLIKAWFKAHNS